MVHDQQRVIELYEKGILTKEEARACFMDMEADDGGLFLEEKAKLQFTLPHFKVFSSSKCKQEFRFSDIDSLRLRLTQGKVRFTKGKESDMFVRVTYPHHSQESQLPKWYVEKESLYFESLLPCFLEISLSERWMGVLDVDLGQANARFDHLPFEDICIYSDRDQKQQEIHIASSGHSPQHISVQVTHASLSVLLAKQQGLSGKIVSSKGQVLLNRKYQTSPVELGKKGNIPVMLSVVTLDSPVLLKEVRHVWPLSTTP